MDESSGAVIAVVVVPVLLGLGLYVFSSIALGKVFVKLGEQAWKAWVPIVNIITLFELGRYPALWVVGLFIPVVDIGALIVFILAVNNVNRRLGHGGGFTLLYLVAFPIWAGMLGFGKSVNTGWLPVPAATGYVPFTPVPPLTGPAAPNAMPVPAVPVPAASAAAPAAAVPAVLPVLPVQPVPPVTAAPAAADPPSVLPAPSTTPAPPVVRGLPTGPPPFYVRSPVSSPVESPVESRVESPLEPPVAAAPTASPAPDVQTAPAIPVVPAPGAPLASIPASIPAASATDRTETETETELAEDDDFDETMIVVRRMKPWTLETEHGLKVSLTKPVVLLGRNPARGSAHPDAQLVLLQDPGKTVSKTHARLDFVDGAWGIRDLQSTNGIVLIDGAGDESELDAGAGASLTERFLLGELAARIYLED
ncbi:FHA domain-containing protein [Cryobacterium sp. Hh11]|uniref:DUF5684 domain-containing protein n=1 Tax=Cryobacterium sp. Hh11 TaxID=2555868 RepID=UPI00106B9967|nr:DUF5684 domain-containing protein [Cryobacterium sp. Hh11]TFD48404.1 FHA domain-containing protein [Cryobacterium sp. Hh11]